MSQSMSLIPESVRIVEVGARDGLQNESAPFDSAFREELIRKLLCCGFQNIEMGAFVSPHWVPKMADTGPILQHFDTADKSKFSVLVPNLQGLEVAIQHGVKEIAVFAAASEMFSQKNINCSIKESIQRFKLVCNEAIQNGIRVRGYISCVLGCPYQGSVNPIIVADIAERLLHLGCYEVSLGDTIGVGTANRAAELIQVVTRHNPVRHFAVHFHDTYGQALANIYAALQQGIATIDSAVSGLGGCPYAPGAAGNVATEDVLYMLDGMNIEHNINSKAVTETAHFVLNKLGKSPISRVSAATRNL